MTGERAASPSTARRGQAWTIQEDRQLHGKFLVRQSVASMALASQRSTGGIRARLRRLGLIDQNGKVVEPAPAFAVPEPRRSGLPRVRNSDTHERPMLSILAVTAIDGWCIDIKSNRLLDRPMIERLNGMLKNMILDEGNMP